MFIIDISNLQDFAVGSYTRSFLASRSKYSKDHCPLLYDLAGMLPLFDILQQTCEGHVSMHKI